MEILNASFLWFFFFFWQHWGFELRALHLLGRRSYCFSHSISSFS
jgi:hypothetical protein